ncbi:DUF6520 family protein [Pedobacter cryotolerans]|uniref:Secreted protein n=1 Tax=Pedobacter cryotolerans TaxID=2571270 RepID=A0A4U1C2S9_9SPHI|nr:DUF6520 family protein [Pedobacter cryotolerans]TKC00025.1 hypothetical protein FA045_11330 [Pedobacter cryotolerans]
MKKLLFSALVAVIAVGGAFATTKLAPIYYAPNSDTPVDCAPGAILCSTKTGSSLVYTQSFSSGQQDGDNRVDLTEVDTARP